jgi:cell division septum initiation protein DivIVA
MTKSQEIAAWKAFAASMPTDSTYSGSWIAEQVEFIAADIRADLEPGVRARGMNDCRSEWIQAQEDANETRTKARKHACQTVERAQGEAAEILRKAHAAADLIRGRALAAIREATRNLEA